MNESIGSKGVGRDFRRTLIIKKEEKEKLKKYNEKEKLKKLEQEVKKKQIYTMIKTLPIAITYETIKSVLPKKEEKKKEETQFIDSKEKKEIKQVKQTEYIEVTIMLEDGTSKVIKVPKAKEQEVNQIKVEQEEKQEKEVKQEQEEIITEPKKEEVLETKQLQEEKKEELNNEKLEEKKEVVQEELQSENKKIEDFKDLTDKQKEKLDKLKSRKIIDVYEKQLKDIRYDLRNLVFEYNVLADESKDIVESKEAEGILDRLNVIIQKVEQLKNKINIDNLDKYDDNYIYTLIEEYLEDFKDKKIIKEIKDSKLYVLISNKLDELEKQKDKLKGNVEDKKDKLEIKEEAFDKLKEKYYKLDKVNKDLKDFQYQQEIILRELRQKINDSTTVRERTEVQIATMNRETRKMLRRLTLAMMFPGIRQALPMAAMTAAYTNFMRNVINPQTVTRRYKVITVKDYSSSIETNLKQIEKASSMLNKTAKQIDDMISMIKYDFAEYIGVIKECDELLSNLDKIKTELHEKEYEINKIKKNQEEELERNNAKVRTIGEYPM